MEIPESLLARILSRKCVLFLGAGATISSGGALGKDLGKYIYDSLGDTGVEYRDKLATYTQLLVNKGYRKEIEETVRKRFKDLTPSKEFECLANIPWKAIYTTNYDDLVEKAYKKQKFYHCVVNTVNHISSGYSNIDIQYYKINGDINTQYVEDYPLVITMNDLKDTKKKREEILKLLMKDLNDTFVFVGYSFEDQNEIITNILDVLSEDERWESVKEKYVVLPKVSEDTELVLSQYRINFIKGTADDFFSYIGEKAQNDYKSKLSVLKKTFDNNVFLKKLNPQAQQYLIDSFDIYDKDKNYSADGKYYYKGGRPDWGIIANGYDVAREVDLVIEDKEKLSCTTDDIPIYLQELLKPNKVSKVILKGTAVSGKSTALYRIAYELTKMGYLAMLFKQQARYKEGLLPTIAEAAKSPFFVLVDDVFIDSTEIIKMINESVRTNLSVVFVISTRNSDWENRVSAYNKNVLKPFAMEIEMKDAFSKDKAEKFVDKLIDSKIITADTKFERNGLIRKFTKNNNILEILFEVIDSTEIEASIATEYECLQDITKEAYGVISLIYKYGYKIRWEVLQRFLSRNMEFTWEDFVEKILERDAKGNIYDDEIQGNFYLLGRSRYICKLICHMHYDGNYSAEIENLESIIKACAGVEIDEKFIGALMNALVKDDENDYDKNQIISLLNYAINEFEGKTNQSFLNHIRGEYYLQNGDYENAKRCFEANVQNNINEEYSLHSLGKTYFFKAQKTDSNSPMFRLNIDKAIEKLEMGVKRYKKNEFYYALIFSIFNYLAKEGKLSEKNKRTRQEIEKIALEGIGKERLETIKMEKMSVDISMD